MRNILLALSIFVCGFNQRSFAQTDPSCTHYMFNQQFYNPASTGNTKTLTVNALARKQWTGFEGAPVTEFVGAGYYFKSAKSGLGFVFMNDELGFERNNGLLVDYSYRLNLSETSELAFGLSAGFYNRVIDGSKLRYQDNDDPDAYIANESKMAPDFDFGLEYRNNNFEAGISTKHLLEMDAIKLARHYYGFIQYHFKLSGKSELWSAAFVKTNAEFIQVDISSRIEFDKKFWVGINYRIDESVSGMAGLTINKDFNLGYSYDVGSGAMGKYHNGSHELMLYYKIPNKKQKSSL